MELKFKITSRLVDWTDGYGKTIYSGSEKVDKIMATFDTEWNDFTKKVVISKNGEDAHFLDLNSSGEAEIKGGVFERPGLYLIGFVGEKSDGSRITSSLFRYRVGTGPDPETMVDGTKLKSLMEQLNEILENGGGSGGGGTAGADGGYYLPSISSSGVLSFTASKSGMPTVASANVQGPDGNGISTVDQYWARGTTSTPPAKSAFGAYVAPNSSYRYLFSYLKITYTDSTTWESNIWTACVYGEKGEKGEDGSSGGSGAEISSITQYYLRTSSASGVTTSTSGWSTTPGTLSTGQWLWTYFKITMSDSSVVNSTPICIGNYNARMSAVSLYQLGSSSTTSPSTSASGWTNSNVEPTSSAPYVYGHLRFTFYPTGSSTSHIIYSNVFRLKTYQASSGSSGSSDLGMIIELNECLQPKNYTGQEILAYIQDGKMPMIYTDDGYMQVVIAEPTTLGGHDAIKLRYYSPSGCSLPTWDQLTVRTDA